VTSRQNPDSDAIPEPSGSQASRDVISEPSGITLAGGRLETLDLPARDAHAPPILLLHEGLGSISMWRDFPAALAQATGARVVAYSRHGFGRSAPRAHPFAPRFIHEEALELLPELRRRLGLDEPLLVGHSTGASMALAHAAAGRWPVAGIVAIAPLVNVEASNLDAIRAARLAYESGDWRDKLARHHEDVDAVFRGWYDIWLDPAFATWTIVPELARIRAPLLAIRGHDDPYCSPTQLDAVQAHAGGASVERLEIEGCGHAPHRERPEVVLPAIARFCALRLHTPPGAFSGDN
jgi:pimeloyl-ACP methyl ester carboxylesterase